VAKGPQAERSNQSGIGRFQQCKCNVTSMDVRARRKRARRSSRPWDLKERNCMQTTPNDGLIRMARMARMARKNRGLTPFLAQSLLPVLARGEVYRGLEPSTRQDPCKCWVFEQQSRQETRQAGVNNPSERSFGPWSLVPVLHTAFAKGRSSCLTEEYPAPGHKTNPRYATEFTEEGRLNLPLSAGSELDRLTDIGR